MDEVLVRFQQILRQEEEDRKRMLKKQRNKTEGQDVSKKDQTDEDEKKSEQSQIKRLYKMGKKISQKTEKECTFRLLVEKASDLVFCCKMHDKATFSNEGEDKLDALKVELAIEKQLKDPMFVRLHNLIEDDKRIYLIYDFCPGGQLFDYLLQKKQLAE